MSETATPSAETAATASAAQGLTWTDQLSTGDGRMDDTHEEFVEMLNRLLATPQDRQLPLYREFVAHTVEHFAQEERWMAALGFAPENCHVFQHAAVLGVLREVQRLHADEPGAPQVGRLVAELGPWFTAHAQMMDAALAQTMAEHGFDPETGAVANPPAPEAELITGCGSATCN